MPTDPLVTRLRSLQQQLLELAAEASELCGRAESRVPVQWPDPSPSDLMIDRRQRIEHGNSRRELYALPLTPDPVV
jgi:hypothetical protein